MNEMQMRQKWMEQVLNMLEYHLGSSSEIIWYDYTREYKKVIADIRGGYITGRRVGDSELPLGLELSPGINRDGDRYNCLTQTRDAKTLRSSTVYLSDSTGKTLAALSINTDITSTLKLESFLHRYNNFQIKTDSESTAKGNVRQILEDFLQEGESRIGKPASAMTREDKITMIQFLDENDVFLISRSSDRVSEFLGISRYTLYNYLDSARERRTDHHTDGPV